MPESLSNNELERILQLQTELASVTLDVSSLIHLITLRTREMLNSDGVVFELKEGEELVYRSVNGLGQSQIGLRIPLKGSFSGASIEAKEPLICYDSENDSRVNLEACRRVGLRSMMVQPLFFDGEVIGVLKVYSAKTNEFNAHKSTFLKIISGSMAATLFHAYKWMDREKHIQSLSYLASHDSMTGLFNRSAFFDHMRKKIESAHSLQTKFAVGMSDLDGLKYVNDTYGHAAGDYFISTFAKRLDLHHSDGEKVAARFGGDEFALFVSKSEQGRSLYESVQDIVRKAEGEFRYESHTLSLQASVGIAVFPDEGTEPEKLIEIADSRLYENKRDRKMNNGAAKN